MKQSASLLRFKLAAIVCVGASLLTLAFPAAASNRCPKALCDVTQINEACRIGRTSKQDQDCYYLSSGKYKGCWNKKDDNGDSYMKKESCHVKSLF